MIALKISNKNLNNFLNYTVNHLLFFFIAILTILIVHVKSQLQRCCTKSRYRILKLSRISNSQIEPHLKFSN